MMHSDLRPSGNRYCEYINPVPGKAVHTSIFTCCKKMFEWRIFWTAKHVVW